jgi:predicted RNase H-like HicB family nuclease
MKNFQNFTAIIEREDESYVALCPELDVASQDDTIEEAKKNLQEAIELLFEHASKDEIKSRLKNDFFITNMQIAVG